MNVAKKPTKENGPFVLAMTHNYPAASPSPDWMRDIEERAPLFLESDPGRPGAAYLRLAVSHAQLARLAIREGHAQGAAMAAAAAVAAVWEAEMIEARARWFDPKVAPKVATGESFTSGRKLGTVGPVRKFVRGYMRKHPDAKAAEVWSAIKARRDVEVYEAPVKYIRTNGGETSYPRFRNIVSEERPNRPM